MISSTHISFKNRPKHTPLGDPCRKCLVAANFHIVQHVFEGTGDVCSKYGCGLHGENHRPTKASVARFGMPPKKREKKPKAEIRYIGIDGEGQGRKDHRYVLLAASTEDGEHEWYAEAKDPSTGRLTTVECLDMILDLPQKGFKIFSFSFSYDLTKILTDLDNRSLFLLFRPELRQRAKCENFKGPYPIRWCVKCKKECIHRASNLDYDRSHEPYTYCINLQGTKFTVAQRINGKNRRVVIWDLFKFFQAKFVGALKDWKVPGGDGGPNAAAQRKYILDNMQKMKDQRSDFDKLSHAAVRDYCFEECRCIGELAHKLVDSHTAVDLTLKSYYGAGSSGAAMLEAMGIKGKNFPAIPEMWAAIASAFFGGRFENSVIGAFSEELWNYDISSAYVYQLAFLPCLEHGSWKHTTKRADLEMAQAQNGACVRYRLKKLNSGVEPSWGPFPFRTSDGSISFPAESGGGWVWLDEFMAGERIFPNVEFREAWVYECNCKCRPFAKIPEYYVHRLRIGKEGPGIVIKLGMNSCYGKLAQSVGNAIFNSWIWAGMITSGCRAQILDMMELHKDKSNLLMIATDGIYTRERIHAPRPLPTRTDDYFTDDDGKEKSKPLGGWEEKHCPKGVFVARPGIYFPLNPTAEEIKSVRARGVGRSVVLESWKTIVQAWETQGITGIATVANVSRFCGAKTSISISKSGKRFNRAKGSKKDDQKPSYGQWISRKVELSFDPKPKRERIMSDGISLQVRRFPLDQESIPYDRAVHGMSKDALEMRAAKTEVEEQPDGDLSVYLDYDAGVQL